MNNVKILLMYRDGANYKGGEEQIVTNKKEHPN